MPGKKEKLLSGFKLKQDHIFNLGDLYKMMYRWFENNGYKFYEKECRNYAHWFDSKQKAIIWLNHVGWENLSKPIKYVRDY